MDTDSLLPPLFRFAYRMTGSVADAEDIVQECFLAALRPNSTYDASRTPMRTYLFGVARNQALKLLAKRPVTAEDDECVSDAPSPERAVFHTQLEAAVARAVRRLPEGQREVLILAHYEELPLAEIARVMEIEVTAVKSRLQRARTQLKETLAAYATGTERSR